MLDAIRMCGRWICSALLKRITARTLDTNPPSRQELLREFCQRTGWRNRKGKLCLSSANVCVKRLEQQGLVRLPPPAPRAPRRAERKLWDDGLPLPPLPKLPASVEQIADLHLSLIASAKDPQHLVWNRLVSREHPLKGAPLVGAQLRYLIVAGSEVVGAIGFGPPSFYLSCRDCWIGWDARAREQNRHRVIGLSRFLLRPELHCANLASRCYRLVLQRVRADWKERYGVEPLLVETYVDRSTHSGKSLAAANWLRIGQSLGRGRSSPSKRARSKSVKDVWVWQWDPQARTRLQGRTWPAVAPRSLFSHSQEHWVREELDGLDLGHAKLDRRFAAMLQDRFAHPERSFYTSFGGGAGGKAAYAFLENPRAELQFENLLAAHQASTRRRMAAERVVLLAQDTTALGYNNLLQTQGLGPIGEKRHPGRGLLLHTLQAFRLDGIPLGCAWSDLWARDPHFSDTAHRNQQSIDQKESVRWVNAFQSAAGIAAQMPRTALVVCGDRESDMIELYDRRGVAPSNLHFLVRGQHDRVLESGEKLWDCLSGQPPGGTMTVQIPRNKNRPARTATLELRWAKVRLQRLGLGCRKSWGCLELWAMMAREINPPKQAEPMEWVLLTDWQIDSLKTARRLVRWYGLRWGIECWHQVLKDVCRVESRQMKSAQALSRSLALDMIVAWRVLLLCRLGKAHPHLPASLLYSPEELAVLEVLKKNALHGPRAFHPNPQAASQPARLGGERSRSPDGCRRCRRRSQPAQSSATYPGQQIHSDVAPSQSAGGDAGRFLGPPGRRPSRAGPDEPWLDDIERAGPVGENQKERPAKKAPAHKDPRKSG
jgi:hypothetical protein